MRPDKSLERTLRALLVLALIAAASGCVHVKIISADVAHIDSSALELALVTDKELRKYDHTYYADHVYLSYRPSSTVVSSEFKNPPKPWAFPFDASLSSSQSCGSGRYCSRWTIPIADSSNLDLNRYEYILRSTDRLRLRIGGGSMGGGRLSSNVAVVEIP